MTTRFGLCGYGKMGQIRAEAIEERGGDVAIAKVFDMEYAAEPPYRKAPSIEAIIADPEIDAVTVCLPNYLNKPTTIAALDAGKHVFCEKPPAFTADEVREIREAEARSGRKLMYGFNHRHHAAVVAMHDLVRSGSHGRILWMRGRYGKSVDGDYLAGWRADPALAGGGIMLDQGIHMLDLMMFLADQPFDEVSAMVSNLYWQTPGIEDNVFALFRNSDSGLCASLHSTMTQWRHLFSLEVFLERGYMVLNGLKTSSGTYGEEQLAIATNRATAPAATWDQEEKFTYEIDTSWAREIGHFLNCIEQDRSIEFGTSAQALAVMEMIDRIYANERHVGPALHGDLLGDAN